MFSSERCDPRTIGKWQVERRGAYNDGRAPVAPGATNVPLDVMPVAWFSKAMAPGSLNFLTIMLRDAANNLVPIPAALFG